LKLLNTRNIHTGYTTLIKFKNCLVLVEQPLNRKCFVFHSLQSITLRIYLLTEDKNTFA